MTTEQTEEMGLLRKCFLITTNLSRSPVDRFLKNDSILKYSA